MTKFLKFIKFRGWVAELEDDGHVFRANQASLEIRIKNMVRQKHDAQVELMALAELRKRNRMDFGIGCYWPPKSETIRIDDTPPPPKKKSQGKKKYDPLWWKKYGKKNSRMFLTFSIYVVYLG